MDHARTVAPLARAAALGPMIEAAADSIEASQRFPDDLMAALHRARLFHLFLPRALGGEECHPAEYLAAIREIARHDGSVAWNMFVANSAVLIAPHLPPASALTIFGDPRAVVAWGPPDGQTLQAVEGGYLVEGTWPFASGCRQATWMGAHGQVREADGAIRLNAAGRPTTRTVLFPVEAAKRLGDWRPLGLKGTASESYRVRDVFVPEAFSATRETPEARRDPGPLYAFPMQGLYAVGVAGVALGLAAAMQEAFADLASRKAPRGRPRLADDSLVQAEYARAEARLASAHAYLAHVLSAIHATAGDAGAIDVESRAHVRLACSNAIQAGVEVADWTHRAAGVSAIFPRAPFERRFRDIHTVSQQIQSRSAHFEAVGQVLLGTPPPVFF